MSEDTPAVILYSSDGTELAVINGVAIPTGTRSILIAGSDGTNSRYVSVDATGRVATTANQGTQNAGQAAAWFARDDYDDQESRPDQTGAGAVLTFTFTSAKVCLVIVTSQGASLVSRATAGATDTPSSTAGQPCFDGAPTYLPVRTTAVKVFAPTGTTISVVGLIRT